VLPRIIPGVKGEIKRANVEIPERNKERRRSEEGAKEERRRSEGGALTVERCMFLIE
jgi:hypothetical protein